MTNPTPGSKEALDNGCICPVIDNHYGNRSDGRYWVDVRCPLHGTRGKDNK